MTIKIIQHIEFTAKYQYYAQILKYVHKELHKACMIRRNSIATDVKPMLDAQAIFGLIRNTETSEIRILLYKQPPNCAHTMTYVSTYTKKTDRLHIQISRIATVILQKLPKHLITKRSITNK